MLFQQKQPIVVSGKANPGAEVIVNLFNEQTMQSLRSGHAKSKSDGKWNVSLSPLSASYTNYCIKVTSAGDCYWIHDVLIGELWLSGGQSNMDLPLRYILGGGTLMTSATNDALRIFYQPIIDGSWYQGVPEAPLDDIAGAEWMKANCERNVENCSGIAYSFALNLFKSLNGDGQQVPVGIINTAVGATSIDCWMSHQAAEADPEIRSKLPQHWNQGEWSESQYHEPWNQATALFNLKIAPLTSHAVRGFIWCQGESDAGLGEPGAQFYQRALAALIGDWRNQWGKRNQPFILSQLAAYDDNGHLPPEQRPSWAFLREAQYEVTKRIPNTAAIPIHDVPLTWNTGDSNYKAPIHPLDKLPVGERMALAARAIAYGEKVDFQGPVFERMEMSGDRIVVHFRNAAGLKFLTGSGLHGFAVCGADRKFMNATAQIVGDTVEVSNPRIKSPVALTYGFSSMNHCANLFNGAGLPAVPFRTDRIKSEFVDCCDGDD